MAERPPVPKDSDHEIQTKDIWTLFNVKEIDPTYLSSTTVTDKDKLKGWDWGSHGDILCEKKRWNKVSKTMRSGKKIMRIKSRQTVATDDR